MTGNYGPDDATIPAWEAPAGSPAATPTARSIPAPTGAALPPGSQGQGLPTYRSWQPGFMPLRPLTLGDFITLPMKAIRFNRSVLVGGPLLCVIAMAVAITAAVTLLVIDAEDWILYGTRFGGVRPQTAIAIMLAVVVTIVTTAAASSIILPGVSRAILGERITLSESWAIARPRLLRVILLSLIFSVPSIALSLLTSPNTFSMSTYSTSGYGTQPSGEQALLSLAAYPITILLAVLLYLATAAVVLERAGVLRSIRRSLSLLHKNVWRFIGIGIVIYFILGFALGIVAGVAMIPLVIVGATASSLQSLLVVGIIAGLVIAALVSVCMYSYLGTVGTLIYVDLRIRKEGFDVDLARAAEARSAR